MPKLIDYPRTSYTSAWEVAEVVDDTGGKCALETCARKLNRKVSGSFKAIVGSAVKFGLLTSKREMLTTTTLFRRIKHAYDKQEELLFHREAFLTPPLFTQLCRKFRSRELPVAMLDVLLIREFGVEEINAQGVAKTFTDGAHMVGLLDEQNNVADIDQLAMQQPPRRELSNPVPTTNTFRQATEKAEVMGETAPESEEKRKVEAGSSSVASGRNSNAGLPLPAPRQAPAATTDAIASLFGLATPVKSVPEDAPTQNTSQATSVVNTTQPTPTTVVPATNSNLNESAAAGILFRIQLTGPGINTNLEVTDAEDLILVRALLDKIERQLNKQIKP